ncbi:uncharacterized protein APUU_80127A [Aspergillus puulaauensis]|uniref:Uncharacterized protein n=1 Tax=Aspergillus puulaauensis TaxID=1220207 RepID=A0A7R7XYF3_9EURO|nr:uncharacterized protein APUU_80127A [Aspergillus puulaauensis]BCS29824.1 hypothetical protein APUU_80127A [Aspergillus puulaauensis]
MRIEAGFEMRHCEFIPSRTESSMQHTAKCGQLKPRHSEILWSLQAEAHCTEMAKNQEDGTGLVALRPYSLIGSEPLGHVNVTAIASRRHPSPTAPNKSPKSAKP